MFPLDAALRRLTVCQLTHESRGNGGSRHGCGFSWGGCLGQLDPDWKFTIGRRSQFPLVLGHMKRTRKLLCMALFSKN